MICRLLFTALLSLTLIVQSASASDERFGANFLQQLTSAEVDGMGESFVAYSTGVRALNNNPAGLVHAEGISAAQGESCPRHSAGRRQLAWISTAGRR